MISKQKEIYNKLADERLDKIPRLDKKLNSKSLIYKYKGSNADVKLNEIALDLLDKVREGKISGADAKNYQIGFKLSVGK